MTQQAGPRPNLFIIGAAKSGTTSLHEHLASHPDVFMCEPKEPGFFAREMSYYPKDPAWYAGLFRGAGDARIIGESSTHYTKLPLYTGVPEGIAAYSPDARFIYLMRDPVRRAISQYWHHVRLQEERRPMLAAIRSDPQYVAIGDYRMQLEPYFELFGRDRVLVLTFEELVRRPHDTLRRTFTWLGVDPALGAGTFPRANARPGEVRKVRGFGLLWRVANSAPWSAVSPRAPRWLKRIGNRLALGAVRPDAVSTEPVVEYLRPIYRERVAELEAWLGREFPEWTAVFPEREVTAAATGARATA